MNIEKIIADNYIIDEKLQGGMSEVFICRNKTDNEKVVIKNVCKDRDTIEHKSLENEINTLEGLCHAGIPSIYNVYNPSDNDMCDSVCDAAKDDVYDSVRDTARNNVCDNACTAIDDVKGTVAGNTGNEGGLCVVMEYAQGVSLGKLLKERQYSEADMLDIIMQLCGILYYLHTQKKPVLHLDIKPENIIAGKQVYLIDYGTARRYSQNERCDTDDTVRLGTTGYAAPEQFGGMKKSDIRTDIYGLGKIIKNMNDGLKKKRRGIDKIAGKCLRDDRESRYKSVAEVMDDITGLYRHNRKIHPEVCFMSVSVRDNTPCKKNYKKFFLSIDKKNG